MPTTLIETWDESSILSPAQNPGAAVLDAGVFGASLTILGGMAVGRKTADNKLYPLVAGASDGTQLLAGLSKFSFKTDANGQVYYGATAAASFRGVPWTTSPIYTAGIFDVQDIYSAAAQTSDVTTFTATGTVTTGDVHTLTYTEPNGDTHVITFTVGATATATAVANGLRAAWNANSFLVGVGTVSGTSTMIITSVVPGNVIFGNMAVGVVGTGTQGFVHTTTAAGRVTADLITGRPGAYIMHNGFFRMP